MKDEARGALITACGVEGKNLLKRVGRRRVLGGGGLGDREGLRLPLTPKAVANGKEGGVGVDLTGWLRKTEKGKGKGSLEDGTVKAAKKQGGKISEMSQKAGDWGGEEKSRKITYYQHYKGERGLRKKGDHWQGKRARTSCR